MPTDIQALRRVAEAIAVGSWFSHEYLLRDQYTADEAAFIAACDPTTILALLDDRDAVVHEVIAQRATIDRLARRVDALVALTSDYAGHRPACQSNWPNARPCTCGYLATYNAAFDTERGEG